MQKILLITVLCGLAVGAPANARKGRETGTPQQIQQLLACRAVADSQQRLACFDRATASLDQAISRKDLVVVDREQANATRRSLFGFALPNFGGLLGDGDDIKEIESTLASSKRNVEGGWMFVLADGSTWSQSDDSILALAPRKGDKIKVRRLSLGAFVLTVNRQAGIRVKRVA